MTGKMPPPAGVGYAAFPEDGTNAEAIAAVADRRMYARKARLMGRWPVSRPSSS
jgi:hypothetical protein